MNRRVIVKTLGRISKRVGLYTPLRTAQFKLWQFSTWARSRHYPESSDPNRVLWADPKAIQYLYLGSSQDKYADSGKVIRGDWDLHLFRFEDLKVFKSAREHFLFGKPWQETEYYRKLETSKSQSALHAPLDAFDRLYHSIRTRGYLPQSALAHEMGNPLALVDYVSIRIGRDGDLLFEDGQHRLVVAKLLGLETIPVRVTARHVLWHQFRNEILRLARENPNAVYQPLTHPDLLDIPSAHHEDEFDLIKNSLSYQSGDLLDIGANWGYYCRMFEAIGFNCYAVEVDPSHLYFLRKLRRAENCQFTIIPGSIFEYRDKSDFDVVLALNIFHHFLKTEPLYRQLIELLGRLNMRTMFFEPHLPAEDQMRDAYRNFAPGEFVDFVLANSCLKHSELLGTALRDGRPIYRLTQ